MIEAGLGHREDSPIQLATLVQNTNRTDQLMNSSQSGAARKAISEITNRQRSLTGELDDAVTTATAGETETASHPARRAHLYVLFLIFAVSGFAGLIYESIWSHYLKLLLGHAAYAQALVLTLFMGGMAIGAALSARFAKSIHRPLLAYALVEGAIGLLGISFHPIYQWVSAFTLDVLLPVTGSPVMATAIKWSVGGALILPASILLGATFPLMTSAVVRAHPERTGYLIAALYFLNSLGAAFGVLVSGFLLIGAVGLPGTILTAGLLSMAVALAAWLIGKHPSDATSEHTPAIAQSPERIDRRHRWLLAIAALTGFSSFVYEIGWIRMLSLVLGSSTHAFELMLSAFILGLALGSLWIRRRLDNRVNWLWILAGAQILMGIAALASLPAYNQLFDTMRWLLGALARNDSAYGIFTTVSYGFAAVVMLPATFFAGMTLPLITFGLMELGRGERSIGGVYAANTLGAIMGVVLTIFIGLPFLGLKGTLMFGAAVDLLLGAMILASISTVGRAKSYALAVTVGCLVLVGLTSALVSLDPKKLASGVYRSGQLLDPQANVIFHRDGRTASVDLVRGANGHISLRTNGKPDASANLTGAGKPARDEITMVLSGAVPLAYHPAARSAAVIGIGSGMTSHMLLASPNIEQVDTIEIEPFMVEAARVYAPIAGRTFSDPRNRIHIDDAKSFFSTHQRRYDLIVSEPSNPWVSGVASLFSDEFYRRVASHLAPDGMLVQWMQIYEIDLPLVTSVIKALAHHFEDYAVYATDDWDILIVAKKQGAIPTPNPVIFTWPEVVQSLQRVGVNHPGDIAIRAIATRRTLEPLMLAINTPANSDFFPILDLGAPRARFTNANAIELLGLRYAPLPILDILEGRADMIDGPISGHELYTASKQVVLARQLRDDLVAPQDKDRTHGQLAQEWRRDSDVLREWSNRCVTTRVSDDWFSSFYRVTTLLAAQLPPGDRVAVWQRVVPARCVASLSAERRQWLSLIYGVWERDTRVMADIGANIAVRPTPMPAAARAYALGAAMLGHLGRGEGDAALKLWNARSSDLRDASNDLGLRLLHAHAQLAVVHGSRGASSVPVATMSAAGSVHRDLDHRN